MKKIIVLIPIVYHNSRKVCELIQEQKFEKHLDLMSYIEQHLHLDEDEEAENVLIFDLNDFMDEVNDQELPDLNGYFMSYVNFKNL